MALPTQAQRSPSLTVQANDLYALIGKLQVENILWNQRAAALEAQLAALQAGAQPVAEQTAPLDAQPVEASANGKEG